ncbi:MAG: Gfo/Idh/MocA family oxidoreductase [Clostridiales bacterium]|jgi:predicted dehydrogenase|nr:Gfo/Idh/MocA family oxidoreductase [Clostridiales bacterium]
MLKFGIMGCGGISSRFCAALSREKNVEVSAVAAREKAKAEEFAAKYNAKRALTYEELVKDTDVDIIYIGTVNSEHYRQIKLCLENGKNVLCEKPMVMTGKLARECFALAKEKKLFLMEAMWTRCNPCFLAAKKMVENGRIGEVKLISANFCFRNDFNPESRLYNKDLGGGALYDLGVYTIEFATGIMGVNPESVSGSLTYAATGVDEAASITLKFPGGALASLNSCFNVTAQNDANIYGTRGSILLKEFYTARDCYVFTENRVGDILLHEDFIDGFAYQIRHVVDLFERGCLVSDLIPPEDTIACADIFDTLLADKG